MIATRLQQKYKINIEYINNASVSGAMRLNAASQASNYRYDFAANRILLIFFFFFLRGPTAHPIWYRRSGGRRTCAEKWIWSHCLRPCACAPRSVVQVVRGRSPLGIRWKVRLYMPAGKKEKEKTNSIRKKKWGSCKTLPFRWKRKFQGTDIFVNNWRKKECSHVSSAVLRTRNFATVIWNWQNG